MATKKQKPITEEIATAEKDFDLFAGYLDYLQNPDKVLQLECGGDIRKYDDIGRDPHVAGILRTRALAPIGKEWNIVPGSEGITGVGSRDQKDAQKIADFVKQVFLSFEFDTSRRAILRGGTLKGFAVSEVMWDYSEGDISIAAMKHKSQQRFVFTKDGWLRLLTLQNMIAGEQVPESKFQVFTFGDEPTTPYGVGLGRELYWPWWFKKNGIKFWLIFCEKFGMPTVHGQYPPGIGKEQQDKLLKACGAIQTDAGIITPETMNIKLLEAARQGSIDTYESLCNFMNSEMSKSVLGQTLTTEIGDKGSYAASQTHNDVREDIEKADGDILCGSLNRGVVRWLVDYNFGPQRFYPKMWISFEPPEDLERRSRVDTAISYMGYRPTEEYVEETYSIDVDDVRTASTPNSSEGRQFSPAGGGAGGGSAAGGREYAENQKSEVRNPKLTAEQQALDGLIENAGSAAAETLAANEQKILGIVESSKSYDEAREKLQGLNIDMKEFETLIERSALAGLVFGKYAVGKETKT